MSGYSIWVLEYACIRNYAVSGLISGAHNAGTRRMPYGYVYLRGHGRHIMVDVGYDYHAYGKELADQFDASDWNPPDVVLAEVGVRPEDIDTIFVTHAHFDHFGNTRSFPNATFYVQERELTKWVWAMALPPSHQFINIAIDPDDILRGVQLAKAGRLKLVHGDVTNVLPGINLRAAHDTHTYGSMFVEVQAGPAPEDRFVLAGDNVYVYENLGGLEGDGPYKPVGLGIDAHKGVVVIDEIMKLVGHRARNVIPVHEQRLPEIFPSRRTERNLQVTEIFLKSGDESKVSR